MKKTPFPFNPLRVKWSRYLLIFCTLFLFNQNIFAQQEQSYTLQIHNKPIEQAVESMQSRYGISFILNADNLDLKRNVTVDLTDSALREIITAIFRGQQVDIQIDGKRVTVDRTISPEKSTARRALQVTGRIIDKFGNPVIGASIIEKGTTNGITSGTGGEFTLRLTGDKASATLEISYLGMTTKEVIASVSNLGMIVLEDNLHIIDDVVVTALGIKRSEKALSYNVQELSSGDLTTVKSTNFLNSLAGKVAGATINSSAAGPGAAVKVVMRGAKSLTQSNNALYVIDGIPMFNSDGGKITEGSMSFQPGTESAADINPDDIESISILSGPSAAALYGYEGANGVVMITTKKGSAEKTIITVSNSTTFSTPFVMPEFQTQYGNAEGEFGSWGEKGTHSGYNPKDFFNTGTNIINSVSLSTGTNRNQTYISGAHTNAAGILPNNKYTRYNFTIRNTARFFNDKLMVDARGSYIKVENKNPVSQGQYFNPLPALYLFPRGEDFSSVQNYERWDESLGTMGQNWIYDQQGISLQNPYWTMYKMNRVSDRRRYMFSLNLQYDITSELSVSARGNLDNSEHFDTAKRHSGTIPQFAGKKGWYSEQELLTRQTYGDMIVSYNKKISDFSIHVNAGASIKDFKMRDRRINGDLQHVTNWFDNGNINREVNMKIITDGERQQTQSLFASAEVGYKSMLYLTVTGRNDWDSALAYSEAGDKSFFYPSIGLSAVISEMMNMPGWLDYLKARFSFTSVGNAFDVYMTRTAREYDSQLGYYPTEKWFPNLYLKPEITDSYEAGLNILLFGGKVNFDATYYRSETRNQTFSTTAPSSSGYNSMYIQAGNVQNSGVELAAGYQNTWRGFSWSTSATFSYNKNKVKKLVRGIESPITGEPLYIDVLNQNYLGNVGSPRVRITEGGTMGDIWTDVEFKRDDNGYIYLNSDFLPELVNTNEYRKLGSLLPKSQAGWRNSFAYKGVVLNVLISGRFGGLVVSNTQAMMDRYGVSKYSADIRSNPVIVTEREMDAKGYLNVVASGTGMGSNYTYKATNVRLQELSLEYNVPGKWFRDKVGMTVGIIGSNLWMIYNKAPFDPELVASASSTFYTGVDYFMQPSLRNLGFSVKLQF